MEHMGEKRDFSYGIGMHQTHKFMRMYSPKTIILESPCNFFFFLFFSFHFFFS